MLAEQQKLAVYKVSIAILEAIEEVCADDGFGAPSGVLYAALMSSGVTLSQYQKIIAKLGREGLITEEDDCLSITGEGRTLLTKFRSVIKH